MIIVTLVFPDTHNPDNALRNTLQPGIVPERLVKSATKSVGVHDGTFLQLTFEPSHAGNFRGPSDHLMHWLVDLGSNQWGHIAKLEVRGTERNPLMAEVPSFD